MIIPFCILIAMVSFSVYGCKPQNGNDDSLEIVLDTIDYSNIGILIEDARAVVEEGCYDHPDFKDDFSIYLVDSRSVLPDSIEGIYPSQKLPSQFRHNNLKITVTGYVIPPRSQASINRCLSDVIYQGARPMLMHKFIISKIKK